MLRDTQSATLPALPFNADDYVARIARSRFAMRDRGVDVFSVSDSCTMAWLTGKGTFFEIAESIVIGETGPECRAGVPRKPIAKD